MKFVDKYPIVPLTGNCKQKGNLVKFNLNVTVRFFVNKAINHFHIKDHTDQ